MLPCRLPVLFIPSTLFDSVRNILPSASSLTRSLSESRLRHGRVSILTRGAIIGLLLEAMRSSFSLLYSIDDAVCPFTTTLHVHMDPMVSLRPWTVSLCVSLLLTCSQLVAYSKVQILLTRRDMKHVTPLLSFT